ncbi:MAG TPA: thioredoxin family protein [Oscillospiraceae bacterium]|nr:thioredoxin family protein [Oscillospiraceae bacterium]
MKQNKVWKLLAVLAIVLVLAGIWAVKNAGSLKKTDTSESSEVSENVAGSENAESTSDAEKEETSESTENPDFALETETIDLEELTSYELPIIIDFGAGWCGPCLQFAPILESVHDSMIGSAIIKYVDVDKSNLASEYPVRVIPTQVFFLADGTPYVPSEEIDTDFLVYNDETTGERLFTVHEGALTEEELNAILADMGVSP